MRQLLGGVLLFFAVLVFTAADSSDTRLNAVGHKLVCTCGCSQPLLECNHVGCPISPKMIADVKQHIATGDRDASIFEAIAAKYGPIALAAPMRGGFDDAAYIVPAVTGLLALLGTFLLIRFWQRRRVGTAAAVSAVASAPDDLRERIRRETEL